MIRTCSFPVSADPFCNPHPATSMPPRRIFSAIALMSLTNSCDRPGPAPAAQPPEVLVQPAGTADVPIHREWTGTLDGSENAEIRARVTGYLRKRNYQEGTPVKKNDVLFEIDARPFESALAQAKSQLIEAEAMQVASQEEHERNKQLIGKKAVSEKEFVNQRQLNESNIAKVEALKSAVEQAELNLQYCTITSPVDGVAGIAKAQVGDLVGTGNNIVLASVSTLDPIKLVFPISEAEYLRASEALKEALATPFEQRRQSTELILADGNPFAHKARLLAVDLNVQGNTGTILVTALAANPGNVLRPGLFAKARLLVQTLKNAVVVPQRAVLEVQGSYQVGVVDARGNAEIRPVQTGPRTGSSWVITGGLHAGETVIVEGLHKVKAGKPVSAKPWVPAAAAVPAAATPPPPSSN